MSLENKRNNVIFHMLSILFMCLEKNPNPFILFGSVWKKGDNEFPHNVFVQYDVVLKIIYSPAR